jgi:hypothetical protein
MKREVRWYMYFERYIDITELTDAEGRIQKTSGAGFEIVSDKNISVLSTKADY